MQASVDGIFATSQKIALTRTSFLAHILPVLVCFYLMGVLVQLKGTRFYRLALLPVVVWLSWRSMFVDMSGGDSEKAQNNSSYIVQVCAVIPMRCVIWAFAREPYRRQGTLKDDNIYTASWNAWDLMISSRGIGWNWSPMLVVPKPALQTDSRIVFVLSLVARSTFLALFLDAGRQIIRVLSPDTFGSFRGGSLFDHTLPPLLEFSRAVFVAFLTIITGYLGIQFFYLLLSIVGVAVFQHTPSQWPPLFDSPWLSTSLTELWGRRWHQMMRHFVLELGVRPFGYLFGQIGGLLGAFLVSGILHDIEFRALGRGGSIAITFTFWMMNGVGVVLERMWKKATGKRVGGFVGWVWTFGWLALWGIPMVNEWAKAGRFGEGVPGAPSLVLMGFVRRLAGS